MTTWLPRRTVAGIAGGLAALLLLEVSRAASGLAFSVPALFGRALFCAAVLFAAGLCRPARLSGGRWRIPRAALAVASTGALAALVAALSQSIAAAWVALAALFASTLAAASVATGEGRRGTKALWILLLAAAAGAIPMECVEIESRFAHEEIFVALEALLLAAVWLALRLAAQKLLPPREPAAAGGFTVRPRALGTLALALGACGLAAGLAAWQRSFSPSDAPSFPGISAREPFLCGEGRPDPRSVEAGGVFARLLSRVEAGSRKAAPEEGMLALAAGDPKRAAAFRARLLEEAAQEEFSQRGETKYWQYEASQRAYYYPRVRAAFPRLFSTEEQRQLAAWFRAINRRALAAGLDDFLYALALAKRPEGPYENQENGAGLLALLEAGGLAAPELSARNRRYLDRARRGWEGRFRNNDDSYGYQPEWINNAYFLSLRSGRAPRDSLRRSFEWLLLQAEPDGSPPDYNAAVPPMLPGTAYLGATLLTDPRLLWLAGRSLEGFARRGLSLPAQPGIERPANLEARSPSTGSCLLYADSGLPNRVGPLAPDKIVLRDGWSEGSAYLLWNLRFTGWHRYRATNAVLTVRQGEVLVREKRGEPFSWLPLERRIFRDKRIPREHTNGLLVEPTGFAAAVARLTGFGGPWAQDPPHFARVEEFRTGEASDRAGATVSGWRGWRHRRSIHFQKGGPIVVVDEAAGPSRRAAAIAWHLRGRAGPGAGRFRLGSASDAELVLVPLEEPGGLVESRPGSGPLDLDILYRPPATGRLHLASVFLTGRWSGARTELRRAGAGRALEITRDGERLSVPLP
ncbi:MAG: hypothetical protein ACRD3M_06550 [Thermoanaerobaculia bacterium]